MKKSRKDVIINTPTFVIMEEACKKVPPSNTVKATGGELTLTALGAAFDTLEKKKDSVCSVFVSDMNIFGKMMMGLQEGSVDWNSYHIEEKTWINGVERKRSYDTPKRTFYVNVVRKMPKKTVLILSEKGKLAKVVISK